MIEINCVRLRTPQPRVAQLIVRCSNSRRDRKCHTFFSSFLLFLSLA